MSTEVDTDSDLDFDDSLYAADVDNPEPGPTDASEPTPEPTPALDDTPEVPEKFEGKSPAEIAAMYQQLEQAYGRQGNELGEVRKVLDDVIGKVNTTPEAPTSAPEPEVDFFDDPKVAASVVAREEIENNPLLKELKEEVDLSRQERAARALTAAHPDYKSVIQSEPFQHWLNDDPETATELVTANQNYDSKIANRILRLYKQTVTYHQWKQSMQPPPEETASTGAAVRRASTGSAKSGGGETKAKPLSRAALVELRITDPAKYARLAPKIRRMYEQGRVQ